MSTIEPVAGEKALGSEDAVGDGVVNPFGIAALSKSLPFEPLDQAIAAAKQRIIFRIECPLEDAFFTEPPKLAHGPL